MKRQPNNNGGFSLLEVILAMAILAIISIPLLSYFTQSMKYNAMMADNQEYISGICLCSCGDDGTGKAAGFQKCAVL